LKKGAKGKVVKVKKVTKGKKPAALYEEEEEDFNETQDYDLEEEEEEDDEDEDYDSVSDEHEDLDDVNEESVSEPASQPSMDRLYKAYENFSETSTRPQPAIQQQQQTQPQPQPEVQLKRRVSAASSQYEQNTQAQLKPQAQQLKPQPQPQPQQKPITSNFYSQEGAKMSNASAKNAIASSATVSLAQRAVKDAVSEIQSQQNQARMASDINQDYNEYLNSKAFRSGWTMEDLAIEAMIPR
jgi:hypothetical protein